MKASVGLCLALMVFISSDLTIQGECFMCNLRRHVCHGVMWVYMLRFVGTAGQTKCSKDNKCTKSTPGKKPSHMPSKLKAQMVYLFI